jgi:hypothetical protein
MIEADRKFTTIKTKVQPELQRFLNRPDDEQPFNNPMTTALSFAKG